MAQGFIYFFVFSLFGYGAVEPVSGRPVSIRESLSKLFDGSGAAVLAQEKKSPVEVEPPEKKKSKDYFRIGFIGGEMDGRFDYMPKVPKRVRNNSLLVDSLKSLDPQSGSVGFSISAPIVGNSGYRGVFRVELTPILTVAGQTDKLVKEEFRHSSTFLTPNGQESVEYLRAIYERTRGGKVVEIIGLGYEIRRSLIGLELGLRGGYAWNDARVFTVREETYRLGNSQGVGGFMSPNIEGYEALSVSPGKEQRGSYQAVRGAAHLYILKWLSADVEFNKQIFNQTGAAGPGLRFGASIGF
ncbi:MAG: hypothetical protein HY401_05820 [Elusimicrobia bacterium]|nr:hypothetical protein [Elusimicrobiota bacterium]